MDDKLIEKTVDLSESRSTVPRRPAPPEVGGRFTSRLPTALRQSMRFEIRELLGRGGYGEVYLATDCQLSRSVALKVPRSDRLRESADLEEFLQEARTAASLRHPGIVTVYDVHSDEDGIYIVMEFVEGDTLSKHVKRNPPSQSEAVRLMIEMAEAIAYAHERGLVHRDLKSANILVDGQGKIRIADFGLAIHERGQRLLARAAAGTPAYMAPEQVRGETHRLDGRTDIWSLGVIFYWLLTGRRPFDGASEAEVFNEILHREPRPPRQISASISRELERICFKCLAKRMSERYATAHDLVDDLLHWSASGTTESTSALVGPLEPAVPEATKELSSTPATVVVPKGLRSFDQHDADFYLTLLPGPFDRHGLPESVRFWKQRIEERDPQATFAAGLMYGPSGCGKTSLLRAGVLPRLDQHVRWVYVEAAAEETEHRLCRAVARMLPSLPPQASLVEMLVELREGEHLPAGEKLFLVLDQFEQWLNGREAEESDSLVRALRQCDGGRVQCLVMVRDDFSMAATRFMDALEVPIAQGQNCAAVDVFHREHARGVLRRFGEAFGRVAPHEDAQVERFIEQAVDLLAEGNVITPVRLAAFAELMRHQKWNAATLKRFGGSAGLGVALLEGCLGEETSDLVHRQHRHAARRVLSALLPEDRTSLKGPMRSEAELMHAAGLAAHPRDFRALLEMLDKELRLISPADPQQGAWEDTGSDSGPSGRRERYYQLAHDYLVPSLNAWLTTKQRETRSGRAMLLLDALSSDWNARPSPRRLPTLMEWLSLRWLTKPAQWTANQQRMMAAADWRHLRRLTAVAGLVACVILAVVQVVGYQRRLWREEHGRAAAKQLLVAATSRVPAILEELDAMDVATARTLLEAVEGSPERSEDERTRARLFLARDQEAARKLLMSRLLDAAPEEHQILVDRLAPHAASLSATMWSEVDRAESSERLLRAACALASWDSANATWSSAGRPIAEALTRAENPYHVPVWVESLYAVRRSLIAPLTAIFRDEAATLAERHAAATALARYLHSDFDALAALAVDATPATLSLFITELERDRPAAQEALRAHWHSAETPREAQQRFIAARRRAAAAIALARLKSEGELWKAFAESVVPEIRTAAIDRCASFGIPPQVLVSRLESEDDPSVRQAALIALAEYGPRLSPQMKVELREKCLRLFQDDPHAGVHSAAEWFLRRQGHQPALRERGALMAENELGDRQWRINRHGITMVTIPGPRQFAQGSPAWEAEREHIEPEQTVAVVPSFAISAHEITTDQFLRFQPDFPYASAVAPTGDCPISNVTWLDAVKFCRWLSEAEGIPEEQMCYPPVDQISADMELPVDWQRRTGYRLPTEAEWECACRADTRTARFFGDAPEPLAKYAAYNVNSGEKLWPVGTLRPNPWGLFDVYGNVLEWCQDGAPVEEAAGDPSEDRSMRSGTYRSVERENRSAKRYAYNISSRVAFLGMRIAQTVPDQPSRTDGLLPQ